MKKIQLLSMFILLSMTVAMAQESKFVGNWKGTYISRDDHVSRIIKMRIKIIDNAYQIRIRICKKNDMNDCYDRDCYGIENNGDTLRWYHKYYIPFDEIGQDGAICSNLRIYTDVTYIGGTIHYIYGHYWNWERVDKEGKVVNSYNGKNNSQLHLIEEAVLFKDDDNW